ncbi:hypothetical protein [Stenotrophomonas sp.]|uniref:hypothetical protein n=1 Tax=Stenotrophomonas sp. TaxID=69392 RepID=UPI002FCA44C3
MSTLKGRGCRAGIVFRVLLAASLTQVTACVPSADERSSKTCDAVVDELLKAVANDRDFARYAGDHLHAKKIAVVWGFAPLGYKQCDREESPYILVKSMAEFDQNAAYMVLYKLYFDDDAAFIEFGFPPTGQNGDAFLRKRSGRWVVTQSMLWEI